MIYLKSDQILLSIETSVNGGSLAILSAEGSIAEWKGRQEISKAEDVLEQIASLFRDFTFINFKS